MADDFTAGAGVGDRIEDVVRTEVSMLVPPSPPCYGVTESVLVQGIHPRPLPAYLGSARADLPAPVAAPRPLFDLGVGMSWDGVWVLLLDPLQLSSS